jgi:hypothetical protein
VRATGASGSSSHIYQDELAGEGSKYEPVPRSAAAEAEWHRQYDAAGPWVISQENLITGSVLPIWAKIQEWRGTGKGEHAVPIKVKIGKLDNGARLIGAHIEPARVKAVLKALGHEQTLTPEEAMKGVLAGKTFRLAQGGILKRSKVSGENRVELEGAAQFQRLFRDWGLYTETIGNRPRWFIPTRGMEVLQRVLKELPPWGEGEEEGAETGPQFEREAPDWKADALRKVEAKYAEYQRLQREADAAWERIESGLSTESLRTPTFGALMRGELDIRPSTWESGIRAEEAREQAYAGWKARYLGPLEEAKQDILDHANIAKKRGAGRFTDVEKAMAFLRQRYARPQFERAPLDTSTIQPARDLVGEAAFVQQKTIERVKANPQAFVDEYRERFGDHFNSDNAAELFPEYSSSPENRAKFRSAVAAASEWVTGEAFRQRLAEPDRKPVLFTAGGTASGKSTLADVEVKASFIVFDSSFSNYELSKRRLQEALDSGRNVQVHYIYRDPLEAWRWTKIRAANEGAGRTVTPQIHAFTHAHAASTVARLAEEFAGDPRVQFRFYENAEGQGLTPGGIELARKGNYTNLRERIDEYERQRGSSASPESIPGGTGSDVPRGAGGLREQDRDRGNRPLRGPAGSVPEGESAARLPESASGGAESPEEKQPGSVTPSDENKPQFEREPAPVWYSQLARTIEQKMPAKAAVPQVLAIVQNPNNGVKPDELKWVGLEDWLMQQGGPVTKEAVLDYLKANQIEVHEVNYGITTDHAEVERLTKELAAEKERLRSSQGNTVKEGDRVAAVGSAPSRGGYAYSTGAIYEAKRNADGLLTWRKVDEFGGVRSGRSDKFVRELKQQAPYPWSNTATLSASRRDERRLFLYR